MRGTRNQAPDKHVIPEFVDEQMGLPVVLVGSAYETKSGDVSGVVVPDIAALEAAMSMARIMDPFKMSGSDLKFLRKAIGMKAIDIARFLEVTPETVSRWENAREPISNQAERIIRLKVYNALRDRAPGVEF